MRSIQCAKKVLSNNPQLVDLVCAQCKANCGLQAAVKMWTNVSVKCSLQTRANMQTADFWTDHVTISFIEGKLKKG